MSLHSAKLPTDTAPLCSICHISVRLETAKSDEDGRPVHEECYLRSLMQDGKSKKE